MSSYKKKSKKNKLTKKQIIIIIACVLIFALLSAIVARSVTRRVDNGDTVLAMSSEEIQKLVESLGCEYISDSESSEEGYSREIYMIFDIDTVVDGKTQKARYDNVFRGLVVGTKFKSLILHDDTKNLTIKIKCEDSYIKFILINEQDEMDYFSSLVEKEAKKNPLVVEPVAMDINAIQLQNIIRNGWKTQGLPFGTKDSTFNKYDIYFDEGMEIRTINKKLYNIVFTNKYKGEVVGGIKVGASLDAIKDRFGEGYFTEGIRGYKTKDIYVFFSSNQISIYPNYNYTEGSYINFENLVKVYSDNGDLREFMDKLTDIWPDYDYYSYDNTFVEITYALRGVRVAYSSSGNEGIQFYENYSGSLGKSQEELKEVHYIINENLILKNELKRRIKESIIPDDHDNDPLKVSNIFIVTGDRIDDSRMNNITILCKNEQYPHSTLDDTLIMYNYFWADDTHLIYNVQGQGIYLYNALTRQTRPILEGNKDETYNLKNYDRESKVLTYDKKKVVIKY